MFAFEKSARSKTVCLMSASLRSALTNLQFVNVPRSARAPFIFASVKSHPSILLAFPQNIHACSRSARRKVQFFRFCRYTFFAAQSSKLTFSRSPKWVYSVFAPRRSHPVWSILTTVPPSFTTCSSYRDRCMSRYPNLPTNATLLPTSFPAVGVAFLRFGMMSSHRVEVLRDRLCRPPIDLAGFGALVAQECGAHRLFVD